MSRKNKRVRVCSICFGRRKVYVHGRWVRCLACCFKR